ncbi:MAG TPA: sialidase family protein [Pseudoxanthomonas sp.]
MSSSTMLARMLSCALPLGLAACVVDGRSAPVAASPSSPLQSPFPAAPMKVDPLHVASGPSPFVAGCDGETNPGTAYINSEVEPYLAVNPLDPDRMVGIWQQDRWSNGSARGLVSATSLDGGRTWTRRSLPFSRCGGGTAGNGGNYARATDPWVSYGPNGTVYAAGLSTSGASFTAGSSNAMLVSRSLDDGLTWSNPATLILDGGGFFNDKEAITADPTDANLVYIVWDRLVAGDNGGPSYFARSVNGGSSWQAARSIYDPGPDSQTIGNLIVVLPDGVLVNMFLQIDAVGGTESAHIAVMRSSDRGLTWTAPSPVAELLSVGTRDPNTGRTVRDASILPQIAVAPNGTLYVAWQDSRFDGGLRDAIVISRSVDDGHTWTPPRRVSAAVGVAAFNHAVHVRGDGMVGVTYYDFRSDGAAATLLTDMWLARSSDGGATWAEARIADPFDMAIAPSTNPNTGGYFVGDYQGLASRGNVFLPFFSRTNNANTANRTDIFNAPAITATSPIGRTRSDPGPPRRRPSQAMAAPAVKARISSNLKRALQERLPSSKPMDSDPRRPQPSRDR